MFLVKGSATMRWVRRGNNRTFGSLSGNGRAAKGTPCLRNFSIGNDLSVREGGVTVVPEERESLTSSLVTCDL
jgi:hypothetical protein